MANRTIADTGVLVALIDRREQFHQWTVEQADRLTPPFYTCEAVVTETCFLLHHTRKGADAVLSMLADGILQIDFSLAIEASKIKTLMNKYADVPMSLADACLVRMSELTDDAVIFTLDSDFHIYRKNGRQKIDLIIP